MSARETALPGDVESGAGEWLEFVFELELVTNEGRGGRSLPGVCSFEWLLPP